MGKDEENKNGWWSSIPKNPPKRRTWTLEDPSTWESDEEDDEQLS